MKNSKRKEIERIARRAAKAVKPARKVKPALSVVPKPLNKISDIAVARSKSKTTKQLDSKRANPFVSYNPPPGVVPAGHKLAMDDANNQQLTWAAEATFQGMWSEGLTFLGYAYLSELSQRPEYRVISSVIATEMTRKWIKIQAAEGDGAEDKSEKVKQLEDALKKLNVQEAFYKVCELDGYIGRSHLYLDTGDTDEKPELLQSMGNGRDEASKAKINPDHPLLRVAPVEAMWCYPARYNSNNPLKPDWYNPQTWFVMGTEVHASRLLLFVGMPVPDILKPAYAFGGLSRSQVAKPYVDNWLTTRQSVNDLIHAFSVMILQTDMQSVLQSGNAGAGGDAAVDAFFTRLDMFNNLRDNRGIFALNKDTEDFKNVVVPLSTLDQLQAQSQEHMAAVSRIPLVKLLGISPHGLNATAEPEIRVFYDTIHAQQEAFFRPNLTRVVDFVQLSLWGEVDPALTIKFEQLWSLDEKEEAEVRKIEAETDDILINGTGSLSPEESRKRIAADPDTPYASLDVDDMPEPVGGEVDPVTGLPVEGGAASGGPALSLRGTTKEGQGPASNLEPAKQEIK